jgi:hypothetical protein
MAQSPPKDPAGDRPNTAGEMPPIIMDGESRMVQFMVRRPLEIEALPVTISFAIIKSLAGQSIIAEAGAEEQQRKEAQKSGILRLTH